MADKNAIKLVANNKKAYHDYFIEEKYECGIELFGTEVKSIRMGKCSIKEAYVAVSGGQAFIEGMNISPGNPSDAAGSSCTKRRSFVSRDRYRLRDIRSCPSRSILKRDLSK